ncbi:MAG: DUF3179 domain-containing protein [Acidobacteriota bacterium]|nr:DUF3179 domain-containing protein [Acidobacteriota bacterium]
MNSRWLALAVMMVALGNLGLARSQNVRPEPPAWQAFLAAAGSDRRQAQAALDEIALRWRPGYAALIVDIARFLPSPRTVPGPDESASPGIDDGADPAGARLPRGELSAGSRPRAGAETRRRLTAFLERQTGQRFGDDLRAWRRWIWRLPYAPHPDYASFKAELYARIDPRFRTFFPPGVKADIRLDEIDWGGVGVNGIPPLRSPRTIPSAEASWLRDGHIVFGILVNGEARAYPKRILAWHEMAIDRLGGTDLTIVYCTLCGTVIPYESGAGGRRFTFGTSGLLYRSNKLMFDEETRSLWSALRGTPVVGPLAGSGLRLPFHSVVTTTWGEWRRDHPKTTVLSLETGYERNYAEGAAYRDYFSNDRLMFEVPTNDTRLKNKAEVLVLRAETLGKDAKPVAIAVDLLRRKPVYAFDAGERRFVVVTSPGGANVVYERGTHSFAPQRADDGIRGTDGRRWRTLPDALVSETGERLARVPAHRAFWFGWISQHPDTVLYK